MYDHDPHEIANAIQIARERRVTKQLDDLADVIAELVVPVYADHWGGDVPGDGIARQVHDRILERVAQLVEERD